MYLNFWKDWTNMRTLLAASVAAVALGGVAEAASLQNVTPVAQTEIFNTEIKRDQTGNGGQRGADIFLRDADNNPIRSGNFNFGASGTEYDFMIGFDGDIASLDFNNLGIPVDSVDTDLDLPFNAFRLFIKGDDEGKAGFTNESTVVKITEINGMAITGANTFTASEGGGALDQIVALDSLADISSIKGTVQFNFEGGGLNGSPNSRMQFSLKALNVTPVPVPAPLALLLASVGGLGLLARRKKLA